MWRLSGVLVIFSLIAEPYLAFGAKSYAGFKLIRVVPWNVRQLRTLQKLAVESRLDFWRGPSRFLFRDSEILVSPEEAESFVQKLRAEQFLVNVIEENLGRRILSPGNLPFLASLQTRAFSYDNFYQSVDIYAKMTELQLQYPTISSVATIGTTVEGRSIKMMSINFGGIAQTSDKPIAFIEAGIHAREWISPASVMYAMEEILKTGQSDSTLSGFDWRFVPLTNPDGYDYSHTTDRFWRKNRKTSSTSACVGVDLNRNFGYGWGGDGSSTDPCVETYRGSEAFSELESQALRDAVVAVKSRLKFYLSVHSYSQLVLIPYGNSYKLPKDFFSMKKIAKGFSKAALKPNNRFYQYGASAWMLYTASGTTDDWAKSLGIHTSLTVELPPSDASPASSGFLASTSDIVPVGKEVLAGLKGALGKF